MLSRAVDTTTAMPRGLVLIAGLLLALRIVALVTPEHREPDLVTWRDPARMEGDLLEAGSRPTLFYYSASWCQPCRNLDREVFHDTEVAAHVNAQFAPVRVMVGDESPPERPAEVSRLMELHGVRAFPTLVVERHGQRPLRLEGYPSRRKVVQFLHAALPPKP